jgi:hypothetical protein
MSGRGSALRASSPARHGLLVVAGYAVLFTWLFARGLVEDAYLAGTDLFDYYLPIFLSPITTWSVYELAGLPAFADPQNSTYYPLNLLFARILPSWTAYIVSAYVLAASFTYAYVYNRTQCALAAAVAGLTYGLSEALLERLEHLPIVHTMAWLPLIVLAIDRLRGGWHSPWVIVGAIAIGNCLLAGHTQPAIYITYLCAAYALIGGVMARARVGYYAAVFTLFAVGGLLAAVIALPLLELSQEAVRQTVSFGQFVSHSNSGAQMTSLLLPAIEHEGREAPTYVGLVALVFALVALRDGRRSWTVAFWTIVAVGSLIAGAGDSTPLALLLYELPLYDSFRVVARHLMLAAFAIAVLSGYGVAAIWHGRVARGVVVAAAGVVLVSVVLALAAVRQWPDAFILERSPVSSLFLAIATAGVCAAWCWRPRVPLFAAALLAVSIVDLVAAQPYRVLLSGLEAPVVPSAAVQPSVHAADLRRRLEANHQRLLAPGGVTVDPVVPGHFGRLWRIPMSGAYGSVLTPRHAALAAMDTNGAVESQTLADDNTALDLLAVRYVTMSRRQFDRSERFQRRGVAWASARLDLPVGPEECGQLHPRQSTYALPVDATVKRVLLVAALRCSEDVVQGTEVGSVTVVGADGESGQVPLRAGIEIADASLGQPARRGRHSAADVFEHESDQFSYFLSLDLPRAVRAARLELRLHGTAGWMQIQRLTIVDQAGAYIPVGSPDVFLFNGSRWNRIKTFSTSRTSDRGADQNAPGEEEIVLLENRRARPRAWLTREVLPLDERSMLNAVHYSSLPDGRRFDPAVMALVDAGDAPPLSYTESASEARTETVEDGHIQVAVSSGNGGFLVLSESFYPGWRARIGDRIVPVHRTNLSLQGVAVPPGQHIVTFEFVPASFHMGAALSLGALVGLTVLGGWTWIRSPVRA